MASFFFNRFMHLHEDPGQGRTSQRSRDDRPVADTRSLTAGNSDQR